MREMRSIDVRRVTVVRVSKSVEVGSIIVLERLVVLLLMGGIGGGGVGFGGRGSLPVNLLFVLFVSDGEFVSARV